MALDHDEMNKRRERREAQRRKQRRDQMKLRFALALAVLILIGAGVGIYSLAKNPRSVPADQLAAEQPEQTTQATTEAPTEETKLTRDPITKIHLRAAGDLNITNSVVQSGLAANGYDFTRSFMDVASELADADITVINLEGNICGEPYGSQTTSAPRELLTALRSAGVDFIQTANSCSINNGLIGLTATLQEIRGAGLEPLGAYRSASEFRQGKGYTMCEVNGVRIAFVAFTKGVGGMGMPAGNEDCVNLLYLDYDSTYKSIDRDGITAVLKNVSAEKPDLTVAMLHWGSENNDEVSKTQSAITDLMMKNGVDLIVGTHPHRVQEISFKEREGTLVAYSLGDFFGDAVHGGTSYSIILDVEITKDAATGTTKVTGYNYIPIYTLKESESGNYRRVVRIQETMDAYEGNFVDKVTKEAYDSMKYALERIDERVKGNYGAKKDEEETGK